MMAIDFQTYLLDDILQKVDRATMTHSLEGREPFLDHRILEFAAQLPDNFKYNNGIKKRILKDITHQYIPQKLLDRPKMGFAIPIASWLNNQLKDYVQNSPIDYVNFTDNVSIWNAVKLANPLDSCARYTIVGTIISLSLIHI